MSTLLVSCAPEFSSVLQELRFIKKSHTLPHENNCGRRKVTFYILSAPEYLPSYSLYL
ncbi:MAG: hypothetical protein RML72_10335 [Bacteroidia bacterium]|nr:hypothetical protein [Bacteroidia bacterium]